MSLEDPTITPALPRKAGHQAMSSICLAKRAVPRKPAVPKAQAPLVATRSASTKPLSSAPRNGAICATACLCAAAERSVNRVIAGQRVNLSIGMQEILLRPQFSALQCQNSQSRRPQRPRGAPRIAKSQKLLEQTPE